MNKKAAWKKADSIFPTDYEKDGLSSDRAGYAVYRSTVPERYYCYICDLGDRLEINLDDGTTVNVWYTSDPEYAEYQIADALEIIDECIYQIDDKVNYRLADETGISYARKILYHAYKEIRDILDAVNPSSPLYERYNLKDAD